VTERFEEVPLPVPDAPPYVVRVDQARDVVWIGTAAADAIVRFEPAIRRFMVYALPTRGALIRHHRLEQRDGVGSVQPGAGAPAPRGATRATLNVARTNARSAAYYGQPRTLENP
jgi:streptogramin lyase